MVMVADSPTLYPELQQASPLASTKGRHGYYRKANGWISIGSLTPANRDHYEQKGFTYLVRYGQFRNDGDITGRGSATEKDARGAPWNPVLEPWRMFFQKGGAKEFPVEQIIAYHWHLRPPYREVTFPQLKGIAITDYFCPECDKGIFSALTPAEAAQSLRTHLTTGIDRTHSYTAQDLRQLGEAEEIDFFAATRVKGLVRRGGQSTEAPSLAEGTETIPELTVTEASTEERHGRRETRHSNRS